MTCTHPPLFSQPQDGLRQAADPTARGSLKVRGWRSEEGVASVFATTTSCTHCVGTARSLSHRPRSLSTPLSTLLSTLVPSTHPVNMDSNTWLLAVGTLFVAYTGNKIDFFTKAWCVVEFFVCQLCTFSLCFCIKEF